MSGLHDLEGARLLVLAAAAASVVVSPFQDPDGLLDYTPGQGLLAVFAVAAGIAFLVGGYLWLRGALQNQALLGRPLPGVVWLQIVVGVAVPVVGPLLLFHLADRLMRAGADVAGRTHERRAWFYAWLASYVLASALGVVVLFAPDLRWLLYVQAGVLVPCWMWMRRFLLVVEDDQRNPAAWEPVPEATPIESDAL